MSVEESIERTGQNETTFVEPVQLVSIEYEEERNRFGFPRRIGGRAVVPPGVDPDTIYQQLVSWVQSKLDSELDTLEDRRAQLISCIQALTTEKDRLTAEVRSLAAAVTGMNALVSPERG